MKKCSIRGTVQIVKSLGNEIEEALQNNNLEKAQSKIDEYDSYVQDANIVTLRSNYYYLKGEHDVAIKVLKGGLQRFPFNFELNFNLGIMYQVIEDYLESLYYYAYAIKYAESEEKEETALASFRNLVSFLAESFPKDMETFSRKIEECEVLLSENDDREFPLDRNKESVVRKVFGKGTNDEYLVNLYKAFGVQDINASTWLYFKTELFKGRESNGKIEIPLHEPSIIPVSFIEPDTTIEFHTSENTYSFPKGYIQHNKYNYFRFNEIGSVRIKSDKPVFIGNPIALQDKPKAKQLVLNIFVDGLSSKFIEMKDLETLMPNSHAFFKDGFISTNCYVNSEWTLPSVASMSTGKYTTNHRLFHPGFNYSFEKYSKLVQEYFKEAGYFTAQICNNWRVTPTYGYYKGYDRILYHNAMGGMDCRDVIAETIEHLETFKEKNNFLWFCLSDLHNVPDEIEDNVIGQVNTDIRYRVSKNKKGPTTVLTTFDEHKAERYYQEAKRLDVYLGVLFDYINKNYNKEDVLVILNSDHGQSFLEEDEFILHESRIKVPLMISGKNVPHVVSDEIIEAVDILPIMLNLCGIHMETAEEIDGQLPVCFGGNEERVFAYTEAIHPDQTYKAVITDKDHIFRFETIENVGNDGSVSLEDYTVALLNKWTKDDETSLYDHKVRQYEEVVYEHIKNRMRV